MLKKFLGLSALGCLCLCACNEDIGSAGSTEDAMLKNIAKNDADTYKVALWSSIDSLGIPGYFQVASEKGIFTYDPYTRNDLHCKSPALSMDEYTLYFDELETRKGNW